MKAQHLELGKLGEERAAEYLLRNGYEILARNWRYGHLELDLVCAFQDSIVFVEVKTRRGASFGGPALAVTPQKQRRLAQAALAWLNITGAWQKPCRFDVICCTGAMGATHLEHIQNAFDASRLMDCGHANWQSR